MLSWESIEARFARLHDPVRILTLSRHDNAGTISYQLRGPGGPVASRSFEALSAIAGSHLTSLEQRLRRSVVAEGVAAHERWYEALFALSGLGRSGLFGYFTDENGNTTGVLTTRDIENAIQASCLLCLQLESLALTGATNALDLALAVPRYSGVRAHLAKSQAFASEAFSDYPNAVKEAVCAVEALAQLLVNDHSATLGDAVKQLRRRRLLPGGLLKVLEGLWGYTSEESGVRHGSSDVPTISEGDARGVMQLCEGCVRILLVRDAA